MVHRAGAANGNADALSRAAIDSSTVMSIAGEGGRSVEDRAKVVEGLTS